AVVRKVTDRIVVLGAGRVVEEGPSHLVSTMPASETGRRLIEAAPSFRQGGAAPSAMVGLDDVPTAREKLRERMALPPPAGEQ
ncbi:MAG: hypothetical protein KY441_08380, partial [Actinobacteria bacterium]|nr:hypothetical protein [Actinomycetota bacterium]